MLTQNEADRLLQALKEIKDKSKAFKFPDSTEEHRIELNSVQQKSEHFIIDINRKGQYNVKKCTYQTRYRRTMQLLRIDIAGPDHPNPDGSIVPCPHIHIYREGYELKWAYPLQDYIQTDTDDLIQVLIDFLKHNNVDDLSEVSIEGRLF